jgi:short-subunit dehydrogenase
LALRYARPGCALSLIARRGALLASTSAACRARGAEVHDRVGDVRDPAVLVDWYSKAHALRPVDLLIVNAGIFDGHGTGATLESSHESKQLVETNLLGAIYTAQAAIPYMISHGHGHIAFVSSLAARLPAADAPTYSATKAALVAYAEAQREHLLSQGVCVSIVLPGHIKTAQTDVHIGSLPMILSADEAARRIHKALAKRRTVIALPLGAALLTAGARWLPWRLRALANSSSRFRVRKGTELA